MKKILSSLLTILLLVSLCACTDAPDSENENTYASTTETTTTTEITTTTETTETTEEKKPAITDHYQMYDNGTISFYYPNGWTLTDGSIVLLTDIMTGNNISIVSEPKNDYYATLTTESFYTDMKPVLESMGMAISEASVKQTQNENDLAMIVITYTASFMDTEMTQTQYIVNADNLTYSVTVTEMVPNAELIETVFNTLNTAS